MKMNVNVRGMKNDKIRTCDGTKMKMIKFMRHQKSTYGEILLLISKIIKSYISQYVSNLILIFSVSISSLFQKAAKKIN
jgi:hypothetical protein